MVREIYDTYRSILTATGIHFRRYLFLSIACLLVMAGSLRSQELYFTEVLPPAGKNFYHVTGIVQDRQGYMWFATKNGLFRYDGYQMIQYRNNPLDLNSLGSDHLESICIDANGIIWIGTFNAGLDRFDPISGIFTHYRHDPKIPSSISNDTISTVFADRQGILWIGSKGLDRFDPATGSFLHYRNIPGNSSSLSCDEVRVIFEDSRGDLWIGTGSVYGLYKDNPTIGGLNKMNRVSGTFSRYLHDPKDKNSLINNKVRAILEDSKGNFWVGTAGDGLHSMDNATGKFVRHSYDPINPNKISRPPLLKGYDFDHITFIKEDTTGAIWIGTAENGINRYDPERKKMTHYTETRDSAGLFNDRTTWWACESSEGTLWISSIHGTLYRVNPLQGSIPFYPIQSNGVTTVIEDNDRTLWVGTGRDGLMHIDQSGDLLKKYTRDLSDDRSISGNDVSSIATDSEGNIWVGTFNNGLNLLDKNKNQFKRFLNEKDNSNSLCNNTVLTIYDGGEDLWIGTFNGLSRMNKKTGSFRTFLFYNDGTEETTRNIVTSVLKDHQANWWAGCWNRGGVQKFDPVSGRSKVYLTGASIMKVFEDHNKTLWVAGSEGLYRLIPVSMHFSDLRTQCSSLN